MYSRFRYQQVKGNKEAQDSKSKKHFAMDTSSIQLPALRVTTAIRQYRLTQMGTKSLLKLLSELNIIDVELLFFELFRGRV